MNTSAFITLLVSEFPDWSRPKLLFFLNELQLEVFTKNTTTQMMMYDATTGKDQKINTVSGTYVYDISTTNGFTNNAWRVGEVYSDDIKNPVDVIKYDGVSGGAAKIVFKDDPGTSSYFVRCYRYPTSLTTESVQLEIPSAYHYSHIYEGMCGIVEKQRSGKSERWEKYEKILLPDLIMKMSNANNFYTVPYKGY